MGEPADENLTEVPGYALKFHRSELEQALALPDPLPNIYLPRAELEKQLREVRAEQGRRSADAHP
jgi:hypothetical protein